jgi:hypothetical protein
VNKDWMAVLASGTQGEHKEIVDSTSWSTGLTRRAVIGPTSSFDLKWNGFLAQG